MRRSYSFKKTWDSTSVEPLVRLWLLRLLVPMGVGKHTFSERSKYDYEHGESLFHFLADIFDTENEWYTKSNNRINPNKALHCLHKLYVAEEKKPRKAKAPRILAANVERLSKLAGLSPTDCQILEFAVLLYSDEILDEACSLLGELTIAKLFKVLSKLLDLPEADVRRSLSKKGSLFRSGLLSLFKDTLKYELNILLELISSRFADTMVSTDADPVDLLQDVVFPSSPPHLNIGDFSHKAKEIDMLLPYLKKSQNTGRCGVNILLYGDPGTGKSQLARILAKETGCELFEVASEDERGEPLNDKERLRSFHAAQALLTGRKIIILFDEIEDIFDTSNSSIFAKMFGTENKGRNSKAWLNRRLEENQTPTVWIANVINEMHPAFKRRFDMIVKMAVPPKRQRKKIIRASCSDLLGERDIERISNAECLAPAIVTRASSVVAAIGDELAQKDQAPALELIINNTLEAQEHKRIPRYDPNRLPEIYDPALIHTDTDVEGIATGLKNTRAGRLCLYGPSGTGKTAYGRWLAERLTVPLVVKRGSDLISMWVGETEKNIAESFQQAETEGAILMIDEIEGFLQDRREAKHNWEVTGVNEMLTQMEAFAGIFIASTNLRDNLDQASLRRFDLKIKFDFLLPRQSKALLESYCKSLNLDNQDKTLVARIGRLNNLTPGDFASIVRRHRFKPVCSAADMLTALEEECSLKENFKRPIGFC